MAIFRPPSYLDPFSGIIAGRGLFGKPFVCNWPIPTNISERK